MRGRAALSPYDTRRLPAPTSRWEAGFHGLLLWAAARARFALLAAEDGANMAACLRDCAARDLHETDDPLDF